MSPVFKSSDISALFSVPSWASTMSPAILWGSFAVAVFLFIVISIILIYHWRAYGRSAILIKTMATTYFVGAFVLLGIMAGLIAAFAVNL